MYADLDKLDALLDELKPFNATLVAVSKKKPSSSIEVVEKMKMTFEKDLMYDGIPWMNFVLLSPDVSAPEIPTI